MAQFTVYKSTDASAPVLSGTTGALVALLDACLVNGYGSKAAAGWAKAFTGTNKAVYRAPSGARLYYRVQDDAPGAGGAREARLRGFVSMNDVDTGSGDFPLVAQVTNGLVMRKSSTLDATARAWKIYADARTAVIHLLPAGTDTNPTAYRSSYMGEYFSLLANDLFNGCVISRQSENDASSTPDALDLLTGVISSVTANHYMARGHTGLGGAINFGKHGDQVKGAASAYMGAGGLPFTNPSNGGAYFSQLWMHDITTVPVNGLRGRLRGMWQFLHVGSNVADGDTIAGTGELAGKTFEFVKAGGQSVTNSVYVMETSNTLETN